MDNNVNVSVDIFGGIFIGLARLTNPYMVGGAQMMMGGAQMVSAGGVALAGAQVPMMAAAGGVPMMAAPHPQEIIAHFEHRFDFGGFC